jgi:DNA-binding GntR family transcriptional regulator
MEPAVERPNRRALADWTVERLYDLIFTGALPAGADLGEEELRVRLNVSRTTVSAALRQLETDGLAVVAAGNGRRVVASFETDDIHELYTIRSGLEELAVRNAVDKLGDEVIEQLQRLQTEMEALAGRNRDPHRRDFEVDFDFHRAIIHASGMARLEICLTPIWNQTHALLRHLYSVGAYGDRQEDAAAYRDHRKIIAALTARDADQAVSAVRAHLHGRRDQLIAGVRQRGQVI